MVDLVLSIFLTLLAFIGFLFNIYIVVSVAMTKQVSFFPKLIYKPFNEKTKSIFKGLNGA